MKLSKIIYIILSFALLISLPFLALDLDWSNDYFLPLSVLAITAILALAAVNFQKAILLIIFIMPAVSHFNYLKINAFSYLPFFNDYTFYLNPASVIYLLIILFGLLAIFENWQNLKTLPLKHIISAAVILTAVSIFWSTDGKTSLIELIYLLVLFFMYIIAYTNFKGELAFIKLLLAAALSSIIPLIAASAQLMTGNYYYEIGSPLGRLTGGLDHPNTFGLFLFLVIGLIITLYLAKADRVFKNNKLIFFYLGGMLFFFILTYSRTSWFCFALFIILLIFRERKIIWPLLAALPLAAVIFVAFESVRNRILEIFDTAIFSSMTARLNIWQVAIKQILLKPIFGHGVGTAETVIENAKPWQGGTALPHNDYLLQTLELGLTGLFLFALYTFGAIYYAFKTFKNLADKPTAINFFGNKINLNFKIISFGLIMILIAALPATMFESLSQKMVFQIILWPILGALFSLNNKHENHQTN